MKLTKQNKFLLLLNPVLILIGALIFIHFPTKLFYGFYLFWLPVIPVLALIFSPLGAKRLRHAASTQKQLPWQSWFCSIALLELLIMGGYFAITLICGNALPVNTPIHTNLFVASFTQLLHTGLFPWTLYAVIAVSMGYLAYHCEKDAYFSAFFKSNKNETTEPALNAFLNVGFRRAAIFATSLLFLFSTLSLTQFLLPLALHVTHGFQACAILTTTALLILAVSDFAKKYQEKLFARQVPTYFSIPMFCISLGLLCVALGTMIHGIYPNIHTTIPALAAAWIQYNWQTAWNVFTFLIFIALTPLICSTIARISFGYRVREILIGVLALPIFICILFSFKSADFLNQVPPTFFVSVLCALALLLLTLLLINHRTISNSIFAYLPANGIIKHRESQVFFKDITRMTVINLFLYLTIGVNGLALFLFAMMFILFLTSSLATLWCIPTIFLPKNPR